MQYGARTGTDVAMGKAFFLTRIEPSLFARASASLLQVKGQNKSQEREHWPQGGGEVESHGAGSDVCGCQRQRGGWG